MLLQRLSVSVVGRSEFVLDGMRWKACGNIVFVSQLLSQCVTVGIDFARYVCGLRVSCGVCVFSCVFSSLNTLNHLESVLVCFLEEELVNETKQWSVVDLLFLLHWLSLRLRSFLVRKKYHWRYCRWDNVSFEVWTAVK